MKGLLIVGAGGHGKVCADIAMEMGRWERIAFLDDGDVPQNIMGMRVLGTCRRVEELRADFSDAFVAVGDAAVRLRLLDTLQGLGYHIPVLKHPASWVGREVTIQAGTALMAGTVVNATTKVGRGCILNTGASVDHDCVLEEGVHVSVGAHIAGSVHIGARTWVGIGACVSNNLSLCPDCLIGAGAAVVKDITTPGTFVGVPARIKS